MKLEIKRNQAEIKGMFGGHKGVEFSLSMKLVLTPEETAMVEQYSLWGYALWTRGQLPVTVRTLVQGDHQTLSDVERLLRSERIAKESLDSLPVLFEVIKSFGGVEVVEYPRRVETFATEEE
jgi:hypothetical protein